MDTKAGSGGGRLDADHFYSPDKLSKQPHDMEGMLVKETEHCLDFILVLPPFSYKTIVKMITVSELQIGCCEEQEKL